MNIFTIYLNILILIFIIFAIYKKKNFIINFVLNVYKIINDLIKSFIKNK